MANSKTNNEEAFKLFIIVISVIAVLCIIGLALIYLARFVFWVSVVGMVILAITTMVSFISWIRERDYYYNENNGSLALICLGLTILLYFLAAFSYNAGYSESAIKAEMDMKGYLSWYNQFMNIPNQAIEETIDTSCKDPNYPCKDVKAGYEVYKTVSGLKEAADQVSLFLRITQKVSK